MVNNDNEKVPKNNVQTAKRNCLLGGNRSVVFWYDGFFQCNIFFVSLSWVIYFFSLFFWEYLVHEEVLRITFKGFHVSSKHTSAMFLSTFNPQKHYHSFKLVYVYLNSWSPNEFLNLFFRFLCYAYIEKFFNVFSLTLFRNSAFLMNIPIILFTPEGLNKLLSNIRFEWNVLKTKTLGYF